MNIRKLTAVSSAMALSATLFAQSALADMTVTVSGNGFGSQNSVSVTSNSSNTLTQSNTQFVTNDITANSNSGGNSSSGNTGGNTSTNTGASTTSVTVLNGGGENMASLTGNCGCTSGNTSVTVSGNGAQSDTGVTVNSQNTNSLRQDNLSFFSNDVNANANSGNTSSFGNTGGGNTTWNWWMMHNPGNTMWQNWTNWWGMQNGQNGNTGGTNSNTTGPANTTVSVVNLGGSNMVH